MQGFKTLAIVLALTAGAALPAAAQQEPLYSTSTWDGSANYSSPRPLPQPGAYDAANRGYDEVRAGSDTYGAPPPPPYGAADPANARYDQVWNGVNYSYKDEPPAPLQQQAVIPAAPRPPQQQAYYPQPAPAPQVLKPPAAQQRPAALYSSSTFDGAANYSGAKPAPQPGAYAAANRGYDEVRAGSDTYGAAPPPPYGAADPANARYDQVWNGTNYSYKGQPAARAPALARQQAAPAPLQAVTLTPPQEAYVPAPVAQPLVLAPPAEAAPPALAAAPAPAPVETTRMAEPHAPIAAEPQPSLQVMTAAPPQEVSAPAPAAAEPAAPMQIAPAAPPQMAEAPPRRSFSDFVRPSATGRFTRFRTMDRNASYPDWLMQSARYHPYLQQHTNGDARRRHPAQWAGQDWNPAAWNGDWTPEKTVRRFFAARIFAAQYMETEQRKDGASVTPVLELGPRFWALSDLDQGRVLKLFADTTGVFSQGHSLFVLRDWKTKETLGIVGPKGVQLN